MERMTLSPIFLFFFPNMCFVFGYVCLSFMFIFVLFIDLLHQLIDVVFYFNRTKSMPLFSRTFQPNLLFQGVYISSIKLEILSINIVCQCLQCYQLSLHPLGHCSLVGYHFRFYIVLCAEKDIGHIQIQRYFVPLSTNMYNIVYSSFHFRIPLKCLSLFATYL